MPKKPAILIVDDDPDFSESLVDVLTEAGYETAVADRPETARAALRRHAPPVAMLDVRLGRSSGVDLLSHLRAARPDLICVMMTAHADTESAIAAMRQGAYDYIDKASDPVELLAVLDRCFEKVRLQQENRAAYEALRVAKEAAEKANRSKSEFLANISHELRTPLNAIIGFSELMLRNMLGPLGNPSYEGYLKDIHDSGIDLLNIINDILDLSKAEAGKLELLEQIVDVGVMIEGVCRLMTARADNAGLSIAVAVPPDLPQLYCDRLKLKQVLLNLLSNAIKFTPAGGTVAVDAAAVPEKGFVIAIRDTGIGIAATDLERIMQPFEQVENALNRSHNGTGLGLPLAQAMMQLHGGSLDIESNVGQGTSVTIRFPVERIAESLPDEQRSAAS